MEFILRCNDLKCRSQLHDQAVVTTCSHVFCTQCADTSGLSRAPNGNRQCPACGTQLVNPDDVVVSGLNPSEDYKTSVLSGLSPAVILECASRGLGFYTYQSSQEIIYQEYLAKSLAEKYSTLSQHMDQLIHDANAQIKTLQEKLQGMQVEMGAMEEKNHELVNAFREKSKAQHHLQQLYQKLKNQCMVPQVANAASNEADFAIQTAHGDRFVDKIPGTRAGTTNFTHINGGNRQGRQSMQHNREGSGSSGSSGHRLTGNYGPSPSWNNQSQSHDIGGRSYTGRECCPRWYIYGLALMLLFRARHSCHTLTTSSEQIACPRRKAHKYVLGCYRRYWSSISGIAYDKTASRIRIERCGWLWIWLEGFEKIMHIHGYHSRCNQIRRVIQGAPRCRRI